MFEVLGAGGLEVRFCHVRLPLNPFALAKLAHALPRLQPSNFPATHRLRRIDDQRPSDTRPDTPPNTNAMADTRLTYRRRQP